jgi:hypothetical protein
MREDGPDPLPVGVLEPLTFHCITAVLTPQETTMPIPNYRLTNLEMFKEVTNEPRQVAGLYFYQM